MHLAAKYVEFALIQGPIIDPYISRGRSRYLAAVDLAINSRMVGLGRMQRGGNKPGTEDGGVQVDGRVIPHHKERWLPFTHRHRTRLQSVRRHVTHALVHYVVFDTILAFMWNFGASTIADARGVPSAVETFLDTTRFVLFPRFGAVPVPTLIVEVIVELSLGAGIWQGISMGYHSFAALAVGSCLWEVESWEVDIFDAPWKADSLLDMWGRRWHQLFRVGQLAGLSSYIASFFTLLDIAAQDATTPDDPSFCLAPDLFLFRRAAWAGADCHVTRAQPVTTGLFLCAVGFGWGDRGDLSQGDREEGEGEVGENLDLGMVLVHGPLGCEDLAGWWDRWQSAVAVGSGLETGTSSGGMDHEVGL